MDDFSTLVKICPNCDVTGTVVNPKFMELQLNGGIGKHPESVIIKCPMCCGSRIVPTQLGEGILDLVDNYDSCH